MDLELIMVGVQFPKERLEDADQLLLENQLALHDVRQSAEKTGLIAINEIYYCPQRSGDLVVGFVQAAANLEKGERLPQLINTHNMYNFFWSHHVDRLARLIEVCQGLRLLHVFSGDQYGVFYIRIQE